MAIKPISCGISNINLQTVGKTGQVERIHWEGTTTQAEEDECASVRLHGGQEGLRICRAVKKEGCCSPPQPSVGTGTGAGVKKIPGEHKRAELGWGV